jgi:hypothetical protein
VTGEHGDGFSTADRVDAIRLRPSGPGQRDAQPLSTSTETIACGVVANAAAGFGNAVDKARGTRLYKHHQLFRYSIVPDIGQAKPATTIALTASAQGKGQAFRSDTKDHAEGQPSAAFAPDTGFHHQERSD